MAKMDEDFRNWLSQNCYGTYNGMEITPDTKLVSYTFVISAVIITHRQSTRYYFMEAERGKALSAKVLCILCNLIFGWWGFPWGPIWTVKETVCDVINSNTRSWKELLQGTQQQRQ